MSWEQDFIRRFDTVPGKSEPALALSVKVRTTDGCFHRAHAPKTFEALDKNLGEDDKFVLVDHETGPEWLQWVPVASLGVGIASLVFNVVYTCIKEARENAKKGDKSDGPFEVVIRCQLPNKGYRERIIVTVTPETNIEAKLDANFEREIADLIDGWIEEDKKKSQGS